MSRGSITLKRGWLAAVVAAGVAEAFFAGGVASALPTHLGEGAIAVDPLMGIAADQGQFAPNPFRPLTINGTKNYAKELRC